VRYVLTSTFECGSYARSTSSGSSVASSKKPPRRQSRIRAKTDGESTFGEHSQSTEPAGARRGPRAAVADHRVLPNRHVAGEALHGDVVPDGGD
jgi:hypothetical protein